MVDERLANDPSIRRLARSLALSQQFQLTILIVDNPRAAAAFVPLLLKRAAELDGQPMHPQVIRPYAVISEWKDRSSVAVDFHLLADAILVPLMAENGGTPQRQLYVVEASAADEQEDRAWRQLFRRMNELRNVIVQRLHGQLLLILTPHLATLFAREAPDFWSIRSLEVTGPPVDAPARHLSDIDGLGTLMYRWWDTTTSILFDEGAAQIPKLSSNYSGPTINDILNQSGSLRIPEGVLEPARSHYMSMCIELYIRTGEFGMVEKSDQIASDGTHSILTYSEAFTFSLHIMLILMIDALLATHRSESALVHAEEAWRHLSSKKAGERARYRCMFRQVLAEAQWMAGKLEESRQSALAVTSEWYEYAIKSPPIAFTQHVMAVGLIRNARLLYALGEATAQSLMDQSLNLLESLASGSGNAPAPPTVSSDLSLCLTYLGELELETQNVHRATGHLTRAADLGANIDNPLLSYLPWTLHRLARLYTLLGNVGTAKDYLQQAEVKTRDFLACVRHPAALVLLDTITKGELPYSESET